MSTAQCADNIWWNFAPETGIILLAGITPINSTKRGGVKILHLITRAKSVLPYKVTPTGPRNEDLDVLGAIIQLASPSPINFTFVLNLQCSPNKNVFNNVINKTRHNTSWPRGSSGLWPRDFYPSLCTASARRPQPPPQGHCISWRTATARNTQGPPGSAVKVTDSFIRQILTRLTGSEEFLKL